MVVAGAAKRQKERTGISSIVCACTTAVVPGKMHVCMQVGIKSRPARFVFFLFFVSYFFFLFSFHTIHTHQLDEPQGAGPLQFVDTSTRPTSTA